MADRYPPNQQLSHNPEDIDLIREHYGWKAEKTTNYGFPAKVKVIPLFDDVDATVADIRKARADAEAAT